MTARTVGKTSRRRKGAAARSTEASRSQGRHWFDVFSLECGLGDPNLPTRASLPAESRLMLLWAAALPALPSTFAEPPVPTTQKGRSTGWVVRVVLDFAFDAADTRPAG
jgi:hypothetical protein